MRNSHVYVINYIRISHEPFSAVLELGAAKRNNTHTAKMTKNGEKENRLTGTLYTCEETIDFVHMSKV